MDQQQRLWLDTWTEWSRRILIAAAMGATILVGRTVLAQEPVVWHCWFEAQHTVVYCEATRPLPPQQVAALGDFRGPLLADGEPLETVPASLDQPGAQAPHSRWWFRVFTVPRDMERVRTLAENLMCGTAPDCQVLFSSPR